MTETDFQSRHCMNGCGTWIEQHDERVEVAWQHQRIESLAGIEGANVTVTDSAMFCGMACAVDNLEKQLHVENGGDD